MLFRSPYEINGMLYNMAAVELVITMEAFGPEHKQLIINTLADKGYKPKEVMTKGIYN